MKRLGIVATLGVAFIANAAGRFDERLTPEKQIVHVLNRLTFGAKPGDVDEVRRMGVDKWIDLQLHPERIAESPVLETKLKTLRTLELSMWQIQEQYPPVPAAFMVRPPSFVAMNGLTPVTRARLLNGSMEERRSTLASLDAETRQL